ncbi:hypothetical protein C8Q80DRAFT_621687 [Daedaleopsis nitida]|nr:hypothetical protein C8Q80DRAFT_621687 [Daedaleopsis nitida]
MEASPPLLVILFLPPLSLELCLQLGGMMTLPLQYRLVSSGDPSCFSGVLCYQSFDWKLGASDEQRWLRFFCTNVLPVVNGFFRYYKFRVLL